MIALPGLPPYCEFEEDNAMRFFLILAAALALCLQISAPAWAEQLKCTPCSHAFGKVEIGSAASFKIILTNSSNKSLRIDTKSKRGSEFFFGHFPLPLTLGPGESAELPITFKPSVGGHATGAFRLDSTAPDSPLNMWVAGTGVSGPRLNVSPSTLDFGNVSVGSTATASVTLSASEGDVTISSDELTSSEFALHGLALPVTIPSGTTILAKVQFTPSQSGTAQGEVKFSGDAINSPTVEQMTGTGVKPNSHSVDLSWQDGDKSIVGYNVYRGGQSGGPYKKINSALDSSTSYTDSNVGAGHTYYYVTTAVNSAGQESGYSNQSKAVIPKK